MRVFMLSEFEPIQCHVIIVLLFVFVGLFINMYSFLTSQPLCISSVVLVLLR